MEELFVFKETETVSGNWVVPQFCQIPTLGPYACSSTQISKAMFSLLDDGGGSQEPLLNDPSLAQKAQYSVCSSSLCSGQRRGDSGRKKSGK